MTTSDINARKPNKKEQASLQMQKKILAVTIDILGTKGYAEVTANNLSREAKISKGALYHHFANLNDVKFAALAALIDQFIEVDNPGRFRSLADYLEATGEMLFESIAKYPVSMKAMYAFIMQAFVDDLVKQQLQKLIRHAFQQYQHAFQHFCPGVNAERLDGMVQILDAYFGGVIIHWFILDNPASCLSSWQQFSRMLVQHLETAEE